VNSSFNLSIETAHCISSDVDVSQVHDRATHVILRVSKKISLRLCGAGPFYLGQHITLTFLTLTSHEGFLPPGTIRCSLGSPKLTLIFHPETQSFFGGGGDVLQNYDSLDGEKLSRNSIKFGLDFIKVKFLFFKYSGFSFFTVHLCISCKFQGIDQCFQTWLLWENP
jgi:hypothetical protein